MASIALILLLPTLIYANIEINMTSVSLNKTRVKLTVNVAGDNADLISDEERETFGLADELLKEAVASVLGELPTDVFLHGPTPWDDIYQTYKWPQVHRVVYPLNAQIDSVKSDPEVIHTQYLSNNSSKSKQYITLVHPNVENTALIAWNKTGNLSDCRFYKYNIEFRGVSGLNKTFSFKGNWGKDDFKSVTSNLRTDPLKVVLDPQQTVVAELKAARTTVKTFVDYEAILFGSVAINYRYPHRGHHFWSWDIGELMKTKNLTNSVRSSECIDLEYYTDLLFEVKDLNSSKVLYSVSWGDSV